MLEKSFAMARDTVSSAVLRLLRDAHHEGRPSWPNFDTITTGAQYRTLHRLCRQWIPGGGRVLDWGAGTGHASIWLSRAGFEATGYSLDAFSFQDLLGDRPYRFVAANLSEPVLLPFGDGEFNAAAFHVERYGRYGALPRNRVARAIPRWLCNSEAFSRIYDAVDSVGAALLPWFVQNHLVVARRPLD